MSFSSVERDRYRAWDNQGDSDPRLEIGVAVDYKKVKGREGFRVVISALLAVLFSFSPAGATRLQEFLTKKAENLKGLACRVFGPLTPAEMTLLSSVGAGLPARVGSTVPYWLPRKPKCLPREELRRVIRAEIIRWLFLNRTAQGFLTQHGIEIEGARIWGPLYLSYVRIPFPLRLHRCFLQYPVNILHLTIPALSFAGCAGSAIYGEELRVSGDVDLRGLEVSEEVRLGGLRVQGNFDASLARFTTLRPCALFLKDGQIGGSLSLFGSSFLHTGAILHGLRVGADADLREIRRGPGSKFDLRNMSVRGHLLAPELLLANPTASFIP